MTSVDNRATTEDLEMTIDDHNGRGETAMDNIMTKEDRNGQRDDQGRLRWTLSDTLLTCADLVPALRVVATRPNLWKFWTIHAYLASVRFFWTSH